MNFVGVTPKHFAGTTYLYSRHVKLAARNNLFIPYVTENYSKLHGFTVICGIKQLHCAQIGIVMTMVMVKIFNTFITIETPL